MEPSSLHSVLSSAVRTSDLKALQATLAALPSGAGAGAVINQVVDGGRTLLHLAASRGSLAACQLLLWVSRLSALPLTVGFFKTCIL